LDTKSLSLPALGTFLVKDLKVAPNRVSPGRIVVILAEVANTGPARNSCSLVLRIQGMAEAITDVDLGSGQSQRVTFRIIKDKPGVYEVDLEGLKGSFTVEG
jgi:hypothetical protein